jgi:hypothetical protein
MYIYTTTLCVGYSTSLSVANFDQLTVRNVKSSRSNAIQGIVLVRSGPGQKQVAGFEKSNETSDTITYGHFIDWSKK